MSAVPRTEGRREERVLVLAPTGRDAELSVRLLKESGLDARSVPDATALAAAIADGAGVAILAEEALDVPAIVALADGVARQPPWSDFPFLIFASSSLTGRSPSTVLEALGALGNVTLLDRPIGIVTLASSVRVALRARRHQYQVRELLRALEEAVRDRDQFLAMLGHELRNPLGALMMAVEVNDLLARERETTRGVASDQWAIVKRQGKTLARLVDDLLDVSRVTSGKIALRKGPVDLADLTLRIGRALAAQAEQRGLDLKCTAPPAGVWVDGDATRLEQVVTNLVQNALKYTPRGGRVDVEVGASGAQSRLVVRDTGVGIEAEMLPRIFDLFRQASRTLDRSQGGLGIGLTLARSLVELHGGAITAESEGLSRGSTFVVQLPSIPAPTRLASQDASDSGSARSGQHLVIVEDHDDNREALALFLQQLGHRVDTAADGATGIAKIVALRPDVAVIDVGLPRIDGYEVARRVRAALGRSLCLIAVTGYGRPEDRDRARDAGFDEHMAKPIDFARLRQLLAGRRAPHPR
jgi:signal transduction histidine kinase/CheY-like chemotaxis protein